MAIKTDKLISIVDDSLTVDISALTKTADGKLYSLDGTEIQVSSGDEHTHDNKDLLDSLYVNTETGTYNNPLMYNDGFFDRQCTVTGVVSLDDSPVAQAADIMRTSAGETFLFDKSVLPTWRTNSNSYYGKRAYKWRNVFSGEFLNGQGFGTGVPGTYIQDFSNPANNLDDFFMCYRTKIMGADVDFAGNKWNGSVDGSWNVIEGPTPTSGTGELYPQTGRAYVYAELSGVDDEGDTYFPYASYVLATTNFRDITEFSFTYNWKGSGTNRIAVLAGDKYDVAEGNDSNADVLWESTTEATAWTDVTIPIDAGSGYECIGIVSYEADSDVADLCIDRIKIVSE